MKMRIGLILSLILIILLIPFAVSEDGNFTLPADVKLIKKNAFKGVNGIENLILPEGVLRIESGAFSECDIINVNLPSSLMYIADDAFKLSIHATVVLDSYAYEWCSTNGIEFTVLEYTTPVEHFTYDYCGEEFITITGYTGTHSHIIIPECIDGYYVAEIGASSFENMETLTHVQIPNTAVRIGEKAFAGCTGLVSVKFQNSVYSLGSQCFKDCLNLESITYPMNWMHVTGNSSPFENCPKLTDIVIPENTTEIPDYAFYNCASLKGITIPDTITYIGSMAFTGCENLEVIVPENCYAHTRLIELGLIEGEIHAEMESEHPYPDDFDHTWVYEADEGYESVTITFSYDTQLEQDYDFIYIYTLDDTEVGLYTGSELAGQSVTIDGNGFKLRLTSDEMWEVSNRHYGFRIVSIVPNEPVPLEFGSIAVENTSLYPGDLIRWAAYATGGKNPLSYDYLVLRGDTEIASGTVSGNPVVIEYTPVSVGEYRLSVVVRDSAGVVLPAQISEVVTVNPSTIYPESAHPYESNTDQSWLYAAQENVESLIITFSEDTQTENGYDYILISDKNGNLIGQYSGTELSGKTVEVPGNAFTIRMTSDGSSEYHGFTIDNIEKYVPAPLKFVSLTADKTKAKVGEPITWTMETESGRRPVIYEYTVTLNDEIVYNGSIVRPEKIIYVPMSAGDYIMSVVAKDADGNALPAQSSKVRISDSAATSEEYFTYQSLNGLYARITGYTGTDTVVIVPETVGEYAVQEIGSAAFSGNNTLKSIILPDTVTTVRDNAFHNCDALVGVDLGKGINTIESFAFYDCDALTSFVFPDSVTNTGNSVLENCDQLREVKFSIGWINAGNGTVAACPMLTKIELPEGMTAVPAYAFHYCSNLQEVILPDTLLAIGEYAFAGCPGLTNIELPEGLTTISDCAFGNCTGLTKVSIPNSVEYMSGFNECTSLSEVTLGSGVRELGTMAFYGCVSLTEVIYPDELKIVGHNAFEGCTKLEKALLPDSVEVIGYRAYRNCKNLSEFRYPLNWNTENSSYGYGSAFEGCEKLTYVKVPEGVTEIPQYAFSYAEYLKDISLPSTLTHINQGAFYYCTALTEVIYPDGLKVVSSNAFEGCTNLEKALLPDNVEVIGYRAYRNCKNLSEFRYPLNWNTEDSSYGSAFEGCEKLTYIEVPEGVTEIPKSAFSYADYLKDISLPSTLTHINQYAFMYCTALTEVVYPEGLKVISANAFEGCTNLEKALLPDSVEVIGYRAYRNCKNLSEFRYPLNWNAKNSSHGYGSAFEGCEKLTYIEVPEGVTEIPESAFSYADYLEKVSLPYTLNTIHQYAFAHCKKLTDLSLPAALTSIRYRSFFNCTSLSYLYISPVVETIEGDAFYGCSALTIESEYGSKAIEHAIENSIPYYYLSLTGASKPSGKLYRGDIFTVKGYARSSLPLTRVKATIYNQDKTEILYQADIIPEAETDFNLNSYLNSQMRFSDLALGSYCYELIASTERSEEILLETSFSIVPPPLRMTFKCTLSPSGLLSLGNSLPIEGTIRSNYPITSVTAEIRNASDNSVIVKKTVSPNTYTYGLSSLANGVNETALASGDYIFILRAVSNNETRRLVYTEFSMRAYDTAVSEEDYTAVYNFMTTPNGNNGLEFSNFILEHMIPKLCEVDSFKNRALLTWTQYHEAFISFLKNIGEDKVGADFRKNLYKQQLLKLIEDTADSAATTEEIEKNAKLIRDSLLKFGKIEASYIKENGGNLSSAMKDYIDTYNKSLDHLKKLIEGVEFTGEVIDILTEQAKNYEKEITFLDSLADSFSDSSVREKELYLEALSEIKLEYQSRTYKAISKLYDKLTDEMIQVVTKKVTSTIFELAGGSGIVYSGVTLAIDLLAELTGANNAADELIEFITLCDCAIAANDTYTNAHSSVWQTICKDEVLSSEQVNKLLTSFNVAKTCTIRLINHMIKNAENSTEANTYHQELIRITNLSIVDN